MGTRFDDVVEQNRREKDVMKIWRCRDNKEITGI